MRKNLKVGLYDPYLDTLGGGEKHILSILEVFAEQGYEVNIFWDKDLSKEIKERFTFRCIDTSKFLPNIFKKDFSPLQTLRALRTFDYFFYVTDGSYFFSSAKKNFIYAMIPDKKLYSLNLINRLKLTNYQFITHSIFIQKWLEKFGIKSTMIMPYLDNKLIKQDISSFKKEKIILSVGRFFSHLHSKRQDLIIQAFKKLKEKSKKFSDYKLVLVGGLKKEDQSYFNGLKELANNDPLIIFKPNVKLYELYKLYELSNYFWHFTGLGVDENKNPELVEHLGITPLEAMASGCLTFCYSAGGPKELITDGENGFLFSDVDKLIDKMVKIDSDKSVKEIIVNNGKQYVKKNFSYQVFKEKVLKLFKVRPSSKD
jgi:glycosyltransferase involved in cell wall biosynthesis